MTGIETPESGETSGTSRIRVVLADDHTLFRDGLREILAAADIAVVADVPDGETALLQLEKFQPEVAIFDVRMPGPEPLALLLQARAVASNTKIVFLSMHGPPGLVSELEANGAAAYLTKSVNRTALVAAIQAVAEGMLMRSDPGPDVCEHTLLTPRELEVLGLLARSKSNAAIAAEMYLSVSTVKRCLASISEKLGATSRFEVITRALRTGLISGSD